MERIKFEPSRQTLAFSLIIFGAKIQTLFASKWIFMLEFLVLVRNWWSEKNFGFPNIVEQTLLQWDSSGVRPGIACGCRLLNNSDLAVVLAVLQIRCSIVLFGKLGARVVGKNLLRFLLYYFFDYCCSRLMTSFNIILGHGRGARLQLPLPLRQLMQAPLFSDLIAIAQRGRPFHAHKVWPFLAREI